MAVVEYIVADLDQLAADLDRWLRQLDHMPEPEPGSTFLHGPVSKGSEGLERTLRSVIQVVRSRPGGEEVVLRVTRSPEQATLGQLLDILRSADRQRLIAERRMIGKQSLAALDMAVRLRNERIHRGGYALREVRQTLRAYRVAVDVMTMVAVALQDPV